MYDDNEIPMRIVAVYVELHADGIARTVDDADTWKVLACAGLLSDQQNLKSSLQARSTSFLNASPKSQACNTLRKRRKELSRIMQANEDNWKTQQCRVKNNNGDLVMKLTTHVRMQAVRVARSRWQDLQENQ